MGKPLSRPDCLRQSPACLGKGEDEDGYIEDCYVPQRSIYDTMRINEQIDQGSKLSQPSKSTLEKGDSSTISSNGTLGPPTAFDSKAPESKKLDERVIFDALKLSSDVSKSAPAPPRRRPNPEKKENVNRRSWKSFMPPNFPEFAERIEASLSEVSEAGVSNPSLQEKQESVSTLAESSRQSEQGESMSEPLTMEHVSKTPGIPEMQEGKQLNDTSCDFSQDECQPLLEPEDMVADLTGVRWRDHKLLSATWPRVMKNAIKAGLSTGRHDTLEADDTDCVVETVPLSPCLSEELLNPGMTVLITPSLREKTESELRFEEDERLIMMEAEEEWEEGLLSEKGKAAEKKNCRLTDISEEREQLSAPALTLTEAGESVQETSNHPSPWQELWDDSQLQADSSAPVPRETHRDLNAALGEEEEEEGDNVCSAEAGAVCQEEEEFASGLARGGSPLIPEQFSDTDSVQMFLELEKLCMNEDERDGAAPVDLEEQDIGLYSGEPTPLKTLEQPSDHSTEGLQLAHLEVSVADSAVVSDLEDFDATYSSQVASTTEPTLSESYSERETSGDSEKVAPSSPPVAKDATSQYSLSSVLSQIEECGTELLTAHEPGRSNRGEGFLDFVLGESAVSVTVCCQGLLSCTHVFTAGKETGGLVPLVASCGTEEDFPSQDELATSAEELDSQPEFDLTKEVVSTDGRELNAFYEPNPSERTDFSNWDVPELVSEDEVAELDKENIFYESQMNEIKPVDSSWVPLQSDVLVEENCKKPVHLADFSKDLEAIEPCTSGHLEFLARSECDGEGTANAGALQERAPGVPERVAASSPTLERDFLEHEDLEWLFDQGGDEEVVGGGGEDGPGLVHENSSSFFLECLCAVQLSTDDFATTTGEEVASLGSVTSNQAFDAFTDSTEAFTDTSPGAAVRFSDTAGLVLAEKPTVSSSAPSAGACAADAATLSRNEEHCGLDGLPMVTWTPTAQELAPAALPAAEEIVPASVLFCMENVTTQPPGREELPIIEEFTDAPVPNLSEEGVQVTQGLGDLVTALPLDAEGLSAAIEPSELEDDSLPLAPGALWDVACAAPQLPAFATPETEEQLTSAVPDREKPSTSFPTAEGPPAGTDGLVPDNEVFVSLLPTHSCVGQ